MYENDLASKSLSVRECRSSYWQHSLIKDTKSIKAKNTVDKICPKIPNWTELELGLFEYSSITSRLKVEYLNKITKTVVEGIK